MTNSAATNDVPGADRPLKVHIITRAHYPVLGGKEIANHCLAEALNRRRDVRAAVVCGAMNGAASRLRYEYPIYRAKSFWRLTEWLWRRNLARSIAVEKPHILLGSAIHTGGLWALQAARRTGLPLVVQSHGSDVQTVPEIGYGACLDSARRATVVSVLAAADHVIAVSRLNKEMIVDLGMDEGKISVIPNGVRYREIQQVPAADLRPALSLRPDDFVLVSVGGNRSVKRLELLFQALALLKHGHADVKCVCVGPREGLAQLAAKHGVGDQVVFTGRIPRQTTGNNEPPFPELINLYRSADLYVSTSYVESFGIAALEALACGRPVLVGARHGIRDVLRPGRTGMVMEQETPQELAEHIMLFRRCRDEWQRRAANISASVSWLTWDHVAEEHAKVYRSVLSQHDEERGQGCSKDTRTQTNF